jgi:hypothetical protein
MAAALEHERELRERQPDLQSPLQAQYESAGDHDLLRLVASPVDDAVTGLLAPLEGVTREELARLRASLTMDDLYTLLTFAKRQAVRSLRANDPLFAETGVVALGLVDLDRVDWRDLPWAMSLPMYVLAKEGADPAASVERMAAIAQQQVSDVARELAGHRWTADELAEWGYFEVQRPGLVGFVERSIGPWMPTVDLLGAALGIAEVIDRDVYETTSITVGGDLPEVWFPKIHRDAVERIAASAPAIAGIGTRARPTAGAAPESLQLTCFLAETEPDDGARLVGWAADNPDAFHASLALTYERFFVLLVARSFVQGTPSVETSERMERFRTPVTAVFEASATSSL